MADEAGAAPATGRTGLTIEAIVAVDSPREFRIHPRDRVVAFTAEAAGARQLFTLSLRGTGPRRPRSPHRRRRSATRIGRPTAVAWRSSERTRSGSSRPTVRA